MFVSFSLHTNNLRFDPNFGITSFYFTPSSPNEQFVPILVPSCNMSSLSNLFVPNSCCLLNLTSPTSSNFHWHANQLVQFWCLFEMETACIPERADPPSLIFNIWKMFLCLTAAIDDDAEDGDDDDDCDDDDDDEERCPVSLLLKGEHSLDDDDDDAVDVDDDDDGDDNVDYNDDDDDADDDDDNYRQLRNLFPVNF